MRIPRMVVSLDGQILTDHLVGQAVNIGLPRDPAFHHDSKFLGDTPGEVELLLDQNDRQLLLLVDTLDDPLDLLDDRRLDTLGRLVQEKEFRIAAERARDRQMLLLATAEQAT